MILIFDFQRLDKELKIKSKSRFSSEHMTMYALFNQPQSESSLTTNFQEL